MTRLVVGTARGTVEVDPDGGPHRQIDPGAEVTSLAVDGAVAWAVLEGRTVAHRGPDGPWRQVAVVDGPSAACLLPLRGGVLVGTEEAHVLRLVQDGLEQLDGFERVEGREGWYTPWGGPPAVRSLSSSRSGAIHANVHVGGIPRSDDGGETWRPTIDVDADVHQVLAHPDRDGVVLAAAAVGLAVTEDGGDTWRYETAGLHTSYARAVAVSGGTVYLSVSEGPRGSRAAVYRASLDARDGLRFERSRQGLPEWFDQNINTGCLAAAGALAAFGTDEGEVFLSTDGATTWSRVADDLPPIRAVLLS